MSDDSGRVDWKRLRRKAALVFLMLVALVVYQLLRVHAEIASAKINFKSLIAEYPSQGEKSFREHLTRALKVDDFHIAPEDLRIDEKAGGIVTFTLTSTKRYRILFFPLSRDVLFAKETLSTAS